MPNAHGAPCAGRERSLQYRTLQWQAGHENLGGWLLVEIVLADECRNDLVRIRSSRHPRKPGAAAQHSPTANQNDGHARLALVLVDAEHIRFLKTLAGNDLLGLDLSGSAQTWSRRTAALS